MGIFNLKKKPAEKTDKDMTMQILLCFEKDAMTIPGVIQLIEAAELFKPEFVSKFGAWQQRQPLSMEIWQELKGATTESNELLLSDGIGLHDAANKNSVFIHTLPNRSRSVALRLTLEVTDFIETEAFNSLISSTGFISGYCFNKEDDFIQNIGIIQIYEQKKIVPIATRKNSIGQLEVDIDKNPGKRELLSNTWLISAWTMWFGKKFYSIVAKEKLLQFPHAYSVTELKNEITRIQLYPNAQDYDLVQNRKIQMSFKEWINYKKLLQQFPDI